MKLKSFNSLTLALITFLSATVGARAQSLSITNEAPLTYTNQFILFAGASPIFSVWASDTETFGYQWVTNGVLDGAATTNVLQMTNVQVGSFSNYCIVTDSSGSVTSSVWTASVIADPTNGYPQAVLADNPVGYWRMDDVNEDGGDNGNGDDGYICHDYIGGNDGIYTNVSLGNSDYNPVTDPSDTSAEFGETGISFNSSFAGSIQNVDFASSTTTNFTIEAWVNGYAGSETTGDAILSKGVYSLNDSMVFDFNSSSEHYFRFYVRSANGTVYQATSKKSADGAWHHLVGVCDETNGAIYFYIDGASVATDSIPTTAGLYEPDYSMSIGSVQNSSETAAYTLQFYGYVNDVAAYNYALSAAQISAQFSAAGSAPLIEQQPVATTNIDSGGKLIVPTVVIGTAPLHYQWYNSYNVIMPGQTNVALTINDITVSTNCYLQITNGFGSTNTTSVVVNVISGAPQIYANITPTNWATYVGGSVTFSVAAYGTAPLYYQWLTNGVLYGAVTTNSSVTAVAALGTNYYYCVVSNAFDSGSVTGSISASLIGVSVPTDPYSKQVLDNGPLAYWPLDETNGDIANDYVGGHDALYTNVQLGVPDFSTAYPDTAAQFGLLTPTNSYAGEIDNSGDGVPNIDFSTEGNAEFSIEAWVNAGASQISGAALVAKGYSGNEQFDMDVESGYFRFFVRDNANVTHICTTTISPGGVWHHVVGVCDELNGLLHLYVDGVDVSDTDIQAGKSVIPMTGGAADPAANLVSIGARSASESATTLNDQLNGILSHVAIYGFALSSNQITADYEAGLASGINANPTNIVTSVSGNLLTLSWPMDHTGWQLQSQTNNLATGIGTNWVNVSGSTATNAVVIPINVTNSSVFYRLMYNQ